MSLPADTDPPDNPEVTTSPHEVNSKVTEGLGLEAGHFNYAALVRAAKAEISIGTRDITPDPEKKEAARQRLTDEELRSLQIEQDGRKQYFELRKKWSWILCGVLIPTLIFQFTLVVLVGLKKLSFTENKNLVEIVCSGNFLQVIGLVYIVVRFLFPSSQPSPQPSSVSAKTETEPTPPATESAKE